MQFFVCSHFSFQSCDLICKKWNGRKHFCKNAFHNWICCKLLFCYLIHMLLCRLSIIVLLIFLFCDELRKIPKWNMMTPSVESRRVNLEIWVLKKKRWKISISSQNANEEREIENEGLNKRFFHMMC